MVLGEIRALEKVVQAIASRSKIDRCWLTANEFYFILADWKTWLDCLATAAAYSLNWVLAKLAPANLSVTLKHAAITSLPRYYHPISLFNKEGRA